MPGEVKVDRPDSSEQPNPQSLLNVCERNEDEGAKVMLQTKTLLELVFGAPRSVFSHLCMQS